MTKDHAPPFPPECKTEEEKKAFAFGWWKAMETKRLAQPKQEPVAWLYIEPDNPHLNVHYDDVDVSQFPHDEWFPVYKSPPQRKWIGLDFDTIEECFPEGPSVFEDAYGDSRTSPRWLHAFARAIESRLKQKNGYAEEKNT